MKNLKEVLDIWKRYLNENSKKLEIGNGLKFVEGELVLEFNAKNVSESYIRESLLPGIFCTSGDEVKFDKAGNASDERIVCLCNILKNFYDIEPDVTWDSNGRLCLKYAGDVNLGNIVEEIYPQLVEVGDYKASIIVALLTGMTTKSGLLSCGYMDDFIIEKSPDYPIEIIAYHVDFKVIERYQQNGDWGKSIDYLANVVNKFLADADIVVMCTNTMHKILPELIEKTGKEFVSIIDTTIAVMKEDKRTRPLLLGTRFTMQDDFYVNALRDNGINPVIPEQQDDIDMIHEIIYQRLRFGVIEKADEAYLYNLINKYYELGFIDCVVAACTELPEICKNIIIPNTPMIDTTLFQAEMAIERAVELAKELNDLK